MAEQLSGRDGRQGSRGKPVIVVLGASIGLMLVAFVALMLWTGSKAPDSYSDKSGEAARSSVTDSARSQSGAASSENSKSVPGGNPAYPQPTVRNPN